MNDILKLRRHYTTLNCSGYMVPLYISKYIPKTDPIVGRQVNQTTSKHDLKLW